MRHPARRSLQSERGFTDAINSKNRIRLALTTFFKDRECVGLQRPVTDEKGLSKLAAGETVVRDSFMRQLSGLKGKVFKGLQPKQLQGRVLNGPMLAAILVRDPTT